MLDFNLYNLFFLNVFSTSTCYRCFCNTKVDPSQGTGGHCEPKLYTELVALTDKTVAVMKKEKENQGKLNEGLWLR